LLHRREKTLVLHDKSIINLIVYEKRKERNKLTKQRKRGERNRKRKGQKDKKEIKKEKKRESKKTESTKRRNLIMLNQVLESRNSILNCI